MMIVVSFCTRRTEEPARRNPPAGVVAIVTGATGAKLPAGGSFPCAAAHRRCVRRRRTYGRGPGRAGAEEGSRNSSISQAFSGSDFGRKGQRMYTQAQLARMSSEGELPGLRNVANDYTCRDRAARFRAHTQWKNKLLRKEARLARQRDRSVRQELTQKWERTQHDLPAPSLEIPGEDETASLNAKCYREHERRQKDESQQSPLSPAESIASFRQREVRLIEQAIQQVQDDKAMTSPIKHEPKAPRIREVKTAMRYGRQRPRHAEDAREHVWRSDTVMPFHTLMATHVPDFTMEVHSQQFLGRQQDPLHRQRSRRRKDGLQQGEICSDPAKSRAILASVGRKGLRMPQRDQDLAAYVEWRTQLRDVPPAPQPFDYTSKPAKW